MINVFSEQEKAAARREKNKLLAFWITLLVLYVAIMVTLITVDIYLVAELRNRDHNLWMALVAGLCSVLFGCYTLFFFSLKFRLTAKYCRMLRDMDRGLKDTIEAKFVGYDESTSYKDGVYFYAMVLEARPLKREDITERKLLIEHTVPKIEIEPGTRLKLISHANILISYEILPDKNKPAAEGGDKQQADKQDGADAADIGGEDNIKADAQKPSEDGENE